MTRESWIFLLIAMGSLWGVGSPHAQAPPTSLKWYAEIAKKKGLTTVTASEIPENDPTVPLKQVINSSVLIDGKVVGSTVDSSDGFQIFTWYRVKAFMQGPRASSESNFRRQQSDIPSSIGQVGTGEVLVRLHGGTAVIEGVRITQESERPLQIGMRYLFFLEPFPNEKAFTLAYQTDPVELDRGGSIIHTTGRRFARRFDGFERLQDLLDYAR